jgi:hypothetical protein
MTSEEERLHEDIRWLFAERRGEPAIITADNLLLGNHTWKFVESRHISNGEGDELKLRGVCCANCGQEWVHA